VKCRLSYQELLPCGALGAFGPPFSPKAAFYLKQLVNNANYTHDLMQGP